LRNREATTTILGGVAAAGAPKFVHSKVNKTFNTPGRAARSIASTPWSILTLR
jgi:hypothetical protein